MNQLGRTLVVVAGGTVGTAAREALSLAVPPAAGVAWVIMAINVVGAFALGWLLDGLALRAASGRGSLAVVRLLLGTGFMGGFTTYSTLSLVTSQLFDDGRMLTAIAYALGTVLLGLVGAWLGMRVARAIHTRAGHRSGNQTPAVQTPADHLPGADR